MSIDAFLLVGEIYTGIEGQSAILPNMTEGEIRRHTVSNTSKFFVGKTIRVVEETEIHSTHEIAFEVRPWHYGPSISVGTKRTGSSRYSFYVNIFMPSAPSDVKTESLRFIAQFSSPSFCIQTANHLCDNSSTKRKDSQPPHIRQKQPTMRKRKQSAIQDGNLFSPTTKKAQNRHSNHSAENSLPYSVCKYLSSEDDYCNEALSSTDDDEAAIAYAGWTTSLDKRIEPRYGSLDYAPPWLSSATVGSAAVCCEHGFAPARSELPYAASEGNNHCHHRCGADGSSTGSICEQDSVSFDDKDLLFELFEDEWSFYQR